MSLAAITGEGVGSGGADEDLGLRHIADADGEGLLQRVTVQNPSPAA